MSKPLNWYLKRHPLLYKIRFRLVSKNVSLNAINNFSYNDINKKNNIPKLFYETNDLIFNEISEKLSDFEKAKTIAIWLKKSVHGSGYGLEAVQALKAWLDESIDYEYILYPVDNKNIASRKIPETLGGVMDKKDYIFTKVDGTITIYTDYRIYKG